MSFRNRIDAGRRLGARLAHHRGDDAVVLALPRGGVPVAFEVAVALGMPLDIVVVRKLGMPGHPEYGIGAVAEGGAFYLDRYAAADSAVTVEEIEQIAAQQIDEVERRVRRWRGTRPPLSLHGKVAILVDDGIATGGTVHAAISAVRARRPRHIVLAVPVAPVDTLAELAATVDEVVCLEPVEHLGSVGAWYDDFRQLNDADVAALLERSRAAEELSADDDR